MNSNFDELYKENQSHDCALITCEGSKDFVRSVSAFFASIGRSIYYVYRLDSEEDLATNNDQKQKCIYFISDIKDGNHLERDLYIAKIAYQLKDTRFFTRQTGLSYIKQLSQMPFLVMRYASPENVMGLQCCYLIARQGMIIRLPNYVYFRKSMAKRYFDLYEYLVVSNLEKEKTNNFNGKKDIDSFCKILKSETGIELVLCSQGRFIMGSPEDEIGRRNY